MILKVKLEFLKINKTCTNHLFYPIGMLLGNYTKPNPASSKWREPLSRRGIDTNNVEDKIKTTKLKDNQFLNFSQTLSLQQTQSFSEKIQYLAQGTVTPDPKKNQLQIVTINDAGDQNVVKTFPIEGPCYSMAWLDDKLVSFLPSKIVNWFKWRSIIL